MSPVEKWKLAKWGNFSASEMSKLLSKGTGSETFGVGARTYINKIARQAYTTFNEEDEVETKAMKDGKMREPVSFAFLEKLLGFNGLIYYGGGNPIFHHYCPDSGCSPDVIAPIDANTVSFGAELKNPTGDVHMEYLRKIKDQYDLKKESEIYYCQSQFSLMAYKCDLWLWCSHNEYFPFKDRMLIVEVKPDKSYQANLDIRLKMAIKERNRLIEELKNRQ